MALYHYPAWVLDIVKPRDVYSSDEEIMAKAIAVALAAVTQGKGGPFGSIIASDRGEILAVAHNEVHQALDVTAHAEVLAIRRTQHALGAFYLQGDDVPQLRLFTTCEPCLMCVGAIYWARVPVVIAAARKEDALTVGMRQEFAVDTAEFFHKENVEYRPDLLRDEACKIFRVER